MPTKKERLRKFFRRRTPKAPASVNKTSSTDGQPSPSEEERPPTVPDLAYDNASSENTLNTHEERGQHREGHITPPITLQETARLLRVAPDALTSEDVPLCSMRPDLNAERPVVHLMQRSVDQHFPKTPADVDQHLQQHLLNVQETVREELVRLAPQLHSEGLIQCYHRQIFEHLDDLLQKISTSQNHLLLIKWVLQTYLSQDLLGHPDLQNMDPIKKVDLLLLTQWASRAEKKILKNVQTEIKRFLENILQNERSHEAHDELYLDTIQCIDAMPREALKISSKLSDQVQEVCLRELLTFLTRYRDEQTDILASKRKAAKMDKPETKQFFKTLNNCVKLKQHIQTKATQIKESPLKESMTEAVATLENMEAFTLKLLKEIVADIAESRLKKYFKSDNREFLHLIDEVKSLFSELSDYQDVQTRVMDEAYKLIAHIYFKRLIKISQRKLKKSWHPDVGQKVAEDAEHLHNIISYLVPGVGHWNVMLLKVEELLDCEGLEAMQMTVGSMQEECYTWSEDLELLPELLQWKGLSRWEIEAVLNVLEDLPSFRPRPASWYSCFTRWFCFLKVCKTRKSTHPEFQCSAMQC